MTTNVETKRYEWSDIVNGVSDCTIKHFYFGCATPQERALRHTVAISTLLKQIKPEKNDTYDKEVWLVLRDMTTMLDDFHKELFKFVYERDPG